jgi:competence protein ComEC
VAAAAATWLGAAAGLHLGVAVAAAAAVLAAVSLAARRPAVAVLLVLAGAGAISGAAAGARSDATLSAAVPEGPIAFTAVVVEDGSSQRAAVVRPEARLEDGQRSVWRGPPLAVDLSAEQVLVAGERVMVEGLARSAPGRVRGEPVAGRVRAHRLERLGSVGPLFAVGNAVRGRVAETLPGDSAAQALLVGFLIGDTSRLSDRDLDALRRSGLTHFVAVSGSNVALFLAAWWILTAPLGFGSRRRFLIGLVGLLVFVVVTRWEASVLRAATMAGLVMGGAAAGVAVDGWMALGATVSVLLLVSGDLALNIGFQLSVAATAGIMLGAGSAKGRHPRWVWTILAAAVSAQLAVLPILLWHFGTVPLLSPVANLLAAPLVSAATVIGGVAAATGWAPLVALASMLAGLVLGIARLAASWPQLGVGAVLALGAFGLLALNRRLRPALTALGAAALAVMTIGAAFTGGGATVTFLDVGQGDAILLRSEGRVALVDGGRDPLLLAAALRSHRVGRIDLLVVTHGDIDHVGGFDGILADHGVGRLWVPAYGDPGEVLAGLIEQALGAGVVVQAVDARSPPYRLGTIEIHPLGPRRRYAADNDGSIVLWVAAAMTVLLAGDAEAIAQGELPALRPDIMLVPHHGAGTTDLAWLAETLGDMAVVSVGDNNYGHPTPEIMAVLEAAGVEVLVTREQGDVTIGLE